MTTEVSSGLELQVEFYSPDCVTRAVADFTAYLEGNQTLKAGAIVIDLRLRAEYMEQGREILSEFLNYALDLTLKARFGPREPAAD